MFNDKVFKQKWTSYRYEPAYTITTKILAVNYDSFMIERQIIKTTAANAKKKKL